MRPVSGVSASSDVFRLARATLQRVCAVSPCGSTFIHQPRDTSSRPSGRSIRPSSSRRAPSTTAPIGFPDLALLEEKTEALERFTCRPSAQAARALAIGSVAPAPAALCWGGITRRWRSLVCSSSKARSGKPIGAVVEGAPREDEGLTRPATRPARCHARLVDEGRSARPARADALGGRAHTTKDNRCC